MNGGALALAFVAGAVATINPCGFALLPAYLSYFLGLDDDATAAAPGGDAATGSPGGANPVLRALAVSAAVTLGFVVVFGLMGVIWSSVSGWLGTRLPYFTIVVGIALVGLGVAMLRGFEPTIDLPKLQLSQRSRQLSSMFLYGVSYAIASLSCTIGVFIAVTSTTLTNSNFLEGVATFVAYGLGMGTTLAVLTIAVALAKAGLVARFRSLLPRMNAISGVLLVLAGVFVSYYAWVEIQELSGNGSSGLVNRVRDLQGSLQRIAEQLGAVRLLVGALVIIGAALVLAAVIRTSRRTPSSE
ncbi:MAG: cytochrome c biogenesis CcdA family protein [Microthrixaceae bacterium]|nr:cytochrome c biogenesis protein CcdA [Microthrixaceae bacterium]MCO5318201.1 cytochrome c biogenesis CcdA family protein [Microthrixaceae bacterium]